VTTLTNAGADFIEGPGEGNKSGVMMQEPTPGTRSVPSVVPLPAERVLHASDGILNLLPVATCVCDLDGRIVQYNERAVEIWDRRPLPGETHARFTAANKFYSIDGRPLPQSKLAQVLETGCPVRNEEVVVEREDGSRVVVLINIDPLTDEHGQMVGVVNCFQDISELKRIHEALDRSQRELREHEQRLAATYEHAAIGIVEIDAAGRFLRVNEAICAITGLSREELLGWTLFGRTHPDDRRLDEELYRRQVAGELGIYSVEKRFVRKDGRTIWIAVRSSTVRDPEGQFLYGVRVVQDITERKAAEERQKLLIDELNHRVKNTLATVQSLAAQSAHGSSSQAVFQQAFEGRLIALAKAHDQLTVRHWESADLKDILEAIAAPYATSGDDQIALTGDSITLSPRAALTLAMAFHELATNAAKYGALSVPTGKVDIRWDTTWGKSGKPNQVCIDWRENGGPKVAPPVRRGFGIKFIETSISFEFGGAARLFFDEAGVRCTMQFKLETPEVAAQIAPN
jgi:PAS domain S-box-containing protein